MPSNRNQPKKSPLVPEKSAKVIEPIFNQPQTVKDKKWITVVLAILLVCILGAGYFLWQKDSGEPEKAPYSQSYLNLVNGMLAGTQTGRGMTYKKPSELIAFGAQPSNTRGQFVQTAKSTLNAKTYIDTANFLVETNDFNDIEGPSSEYASVLRKGLASDSSNQDYSVAARPTTYRAKSLFYRPVTVTFSRAQSFTNASIKKDAWQFDITTSGNSENATPAQKGKAIVLIGKNTYYYLVFTFTNSNWQSNQQVVQQIINSIKIDQ